MAPGERGKLFAPSPNTLEDESLNSALNDVENVTNRQNKL